SFPFKRSDVVKFLPDSWINRHYFSNRYYFPAVYYITYCYRNGEYLSISAHKKGRSREFVIRFEGLYAQIKSYRYCCRSNYCSLYIYVYYFLCLDNKYLTKLANKHSVQMLRY